MPATCVTPSAGIYRRFPFPFARGCELPVFALLTYDSTLLSENSEVRRHIETLTEDLAGVLPVRQLGTSDVQKLAANSFGLNDQTSELVARRAEGVPLFAVELIRHWAETDSLHKTDEGYLVSEEVVASTPGELHEIWFRRLQKAVESFEGDDRKNARRSLSAAAALGDNVSTREWRRAHEQISAGKPAFESVTNCAARHGLLVSEERGWSFAHALVREALSERSRTVGYYRQLHEICATLSMKNERALPRRPPNELTPSICSSVRRRLRPHREQSTGLESSSAAVLVERASDGAFVYVRSREYVRVSR